MRKGILAGGNWVTDQIKIIDRFPAEEELANISRTYTSNGGSAFNILKALSRLGGIRPLEGIGLVGDDAGGEYILNECKKASIDTAQIGKTREAATSHTDVMSVASSGKRTFFHHKGANALLDESHFNLSGSRAKIFHLGYLLLLDRLDVTDDRGSTGAARLLQKAKEGGFLTSADLASVSGGLAREILAPSLPFIDFLFINEIEAGMLTGITTVNDGVNILPGGCTAAARRLIGMGVRQWVLLHHHGGILAVNNKNVCLFQPSVCLPPEKIKSTVGAGDALAAGFLSGIHQNLEITDCLELGACAAAACLEHWTCSEGIRSAQACLSLRQAFGYNSIDPFYREKSI